MAAPGMNWIRRQMQLYYQPVSVWYETTCYPFHANGHLRREGTFDSNEAEARSWARRFVDENPMGAVRISHKNQ